MISKPTIARIFDAARIEEVVGDFLTLKKRGVNYIARCPFHNEKTPSFNVNPVRNIYKCFGCGKAGGPVNFIMDHEKMDYPEALRYLAKKYNIPIEEDSNENVEEKKQLEKEKESLYVISSFAQKSFSDNLLNSDEGKSVGLGYFKERGLSDEIIEKFQLGYSFEKRNAFTNYAIASGYLLETALKAGLIIKYENESYSDSNTSYFDRFAGRVIFPIHGTTGRVIAFAGRALRKDAKAKYVNSPETEIYHKSDVLYGMFFARNSIASNDNCLLVEGYMDALSLYQAGIDNVVASSGTSLTVEQIRLISRYTKNITILYDGDSAGIKASLRGIDLILEEGLNVKVILFPDGHDPDSFSKKVSNEELKQYIKNNTKDFILFKADLLASDVINNPIEKAKAIRDMGDSIARIPDAILRSDFIKKVSILMDIDEQNVLIPEVNRAFGTFIEKKSKEQGVEEAKKWTNKTTLFEQNKQTPNTSEYHEKEVIRLLLSYGNQILEIKSETEDSEEKTPVEIHKMSVAQFISEHLAVDNISFENPLYQKVFVEYSAAILTGETLSLEHFVHHENPEIAQLAIDLTTFPYTISDWLKKHGIQVTREEDILKVAVEHAIYSLKIRKIMKMISETSRQLQEASSEEDILTLVAQKKRLDEAKNIFSKELGWVVLR